MSEELKAVEVKCTRCGSDDFCWPQDAEGFVCMDCVACDMEDTPTSPDLKAVAERAAERIDWDARARHEMGMPPVGIRKLAQIITEEVAPLLAKKDAEKDGDFCKALWYLWCLKQGWAISGNYKRLLEKYKDSIPKQA